MKEKMGGKYKVVFLVQNRLDDHSRSQNTHIIDREKRQNIISRFVCRVMHSHQLEKEEATKTEYEILRGSWKKEGGYLKK